MQKGRTDGKLEVSFSGGKDSAVLLYLMAEMWSISSHKDEPLWVMFANTTNEFVCMSKYVQFYCKYIEQKFNIKINLHVVKGEKNYFEVAHQIKSNGTYAGRFDVTLLINGIPFVQIELKKPGVELNEAFNQVLRYKRDGNYKGLFNLIQLFVISNEQHTKYFANNDTDIKKSNCFVWTDEENERINLLYDFEESFLFCPQLFHVIFDYMIDSKSQKRLFVMRPYQIYAFKALTKRCLKDNENGYCFHSTGSGKTLTSSIITKI